LNRFQTKLKYIKPKDLIFVKLYGGVISILLGIMIGLLDFYITQFIGFSFSMLLFFFSAQYIGGLVRKQYDVPHIVYTIITGVFLVLQAIIVYALPIIFPIAVEYGDATIIFSVSLYAQFIILFFKTMIAYFSFDYLLIILIVSIGTYLGIKRTY